MLAQCWYAPSPKGGRAKMEPSDDLPPDVKTLVGNLFQVFDHYGWRLGTTGMLMPASGTGYHNKTPWMWPGVPLLPQGLLNAVLGQCGEKSCAFEQRARLRRRGKPAPRMLPAGNARRKTKQQTPRRTVNSRMLETVQKTPEAIGWSGTVWAKHLGCG